MTNFNRRSFLRQAGSLATVTVLPAGLSTALPEDKKNSIRFRFAVASDGHFGQPETDFQRYFDNLIQWMKDEKKTNGLDLAIINGDLIHDNPIFLPQVKTYFDQFPVPYYVTRGNHDCVTESVWKATWGYPSNHDVTLGKYAFLLGNTSNEAGEYLCADVEWLVGRLEAHRQKRHVFVFLHIPQELWTRNGVDCPDLRKVMARFSNVTAIFHGHDHELDGMQQSEGKHYFFDAHFGGNWGTLYKGYRIVEIDGNERVQTYQFNPEARPIVNSAHIAN